jgi:nickel-dependent lactate racemase
MKVTQLPYGNEEKTLRIPVSNFQGIYLPQSTVVCSELQEELQRALAHPLGTPAVADMVRHGDKIVILIDDHTRTTPTAQILPPLVDQIRAGGACDEDITILMANGTHRKNSDSEVLHKVGRDLSARIKVLQHDCTDENNQVYLGLTSRGTPVWINRLVVDADVRIGVGHIGPSPYAGYSGGNKLIVPGVAALDTVNANHSLVPVGFRQPGRVDLPCRADIEEAAAKSSLDFVIDVVQRQDGAIVRIFAGHPLRVFEEGLALARTIYEVSCPGPVDIAIACAHPFDIDLYQAVRAVQYADAVVREGGSILLIAACPDGVGGESFQQLMTDQSKETDDYLRDVARRNGKVTFSVLGYFLSRIKKEKQLHIFTEGIPDATLTAMGFRTLATLQAGFNALLEEQGNGAKVAVFPMGSATIPMLS